MGKHGDTKDRILKLISQGTDNLSDISKALDFAPSTVSKHLHDLESAGLIEYKNTHVTRWKSYKLAKEAPVEVLQVQNRVSRIRRGSVYGIFSAAAIIAVLAVYIYAAQPNGIPISITDPPQVPSGTQALYINYSSLSVHIDQSGSQKNISVDVSGSLNLMGLINESEVIADADVPKGADVESVGFDIASASIVINNVTYPVSVKGGYLTAVPEGGKRLNSSSGILLDLYPVVVPYNSTSFVMVPTLRATLAPKKGIAPQGFHHGMAPVSLPLNGKYSNWSFADPNVTISGAGLNVSDDSVSLQFTLTNNGPSNVTIYGVLLAQKLSPKPFVYYNDTANFTTSFGNGTGIMINATQVYALWSRSGSNRVYVKLNRPVSNISIYAIGPMPRPFLANPEIAAVVYQNGTLAALSPNAMPESQGLAPGYRLRASASQSFTYHGELGPSGPFMWGEQNQTSDNYTITVMTSRGIVQENITAS